MTRYNLNEHELKSNLPIKLSRGDTHEIVVTRRNKKSTGPGRWEMLLNPECFILYNFDIGGQGLKKEHEQFLT